MNTQQNQLKPPNIVGNYTIFTHQLLGKGATGYVYRGINNFTKQTVAVKAIDLATISDEATKSLLQNQKAALRAIHAPNIMKLEEIIEDKDFCYIITELCEGTTLKEHLNKQGVLGEKEAMGVFQKITAGCLAITHECIIHRDLKPANIMIDGKGDPKIIDFGYCEIIMAKKVMKTFNVGSPSYMSPEAYLRTLYSEKSDSWSLGVTLYEMLHGKTLDEGMDTKRYFEELKNDLKFVEKRISPSIALQVRQIIEKALKYLPEERASISSLKYEADRYQINLKQKSLNVCHSYKQIPVTPELSKHKYSEVHSMQKIEVENKGLQKGMVTFNHNPGHQNHFQGFLKMKQRTSLQDFDNGSLNQSPVKSRGVAVDEKLNNFLQNTVRQQGPSRLGSLSNIPPLCRTNIHSVREINDISYPLPPAYPRVVVRFT